MGKLERFASKPKEYNLAGEKVQLKPLTLDKLSLITKLDSRDESTRNSALKELLTIYLKQVDPEATDEEIDNVSLEFLNELQEAMLDVNGLSEPKEEKSKVEKLKEQAQNAEGK